MPVLHLSTCPPYCTDILLSSSSLELHIQQEAKNQMFFSGATCTFIPKVFAAFLKMVDRAGPPHLKAELKNKRPPNRSNTGLESFYLPPLHSCWRLLFVYQRGGKNTARRILCFLCVASVLSLLVKMSFGCCDPVPLVDCVLENWLGETLTQPNEQPVL